MHTPETPAITKTPRQGGEEAAIIRSEPGADGLRERTGALMEEATDRTLDRSPNGAGDPRPPRPKQKAFKVHLFLAAATPNAGRKAAASPVRPLSKEASSTCTIKDHKDKGFPDLVSTHNSTTRVSLTNATVQPDDAKRTEEKAETAKRGREDSPGKDPKSPSTPTQANPRPTEPHSTTAPVKPTPPKRPTLSRGQPESSSPTPQGKAEAAVKQNKTSPAEPSATPVLARQEANATATPTQPPMLNKGGKVRNQNKTSTPKSKPSSKGTSGSKATAAPTKTPEVSTAPRFPYFEDGYCPPECACYGGVVQCSDKGADEVPYGIPYKARYVLLMNNRIHRLQADLFREYLSMDFLVLSNNRLTDGSIQGAFQGVRALKRLYLDRNLLESVPADLPGSLEELRLDNNQVRVMPEAAWVRCPGLLVLSLRNNSLGNASGGLPDGALSPLGRLRTLSLDGNRLTSVPLGLPLSVRQLYLRGNRIQRFRGGVFAGPSQLRILDLSGNRLTDKGLIRDSLLNAAHLESLNLEGNALGQVPRHLPPSLKTLNLEGNLISSVGRSAFRSLPGLEHLGLARNRIAKVAPGAFEPLASLHQLDLCHNALRQVPRRLPRGLHTAALTHNRIREVPRDAFCWEEGGAPRWLSGLVRVQLEHNLIVLGTVDTQAFRCLRGPQVVRFH
ncbi:hypothetical protein NHX12_020804 [Muraenolepis orangiensis]|uniref:LRRNT domain-containing protein n=1 Tax=Muraenolepis orangiensis TaxID=630683 RepID=A0A9Q0EU77_9TELE|nr:hypothetical protein NHX12_020804 [Muraenolepis orangiensis]